MEGLAGFYRGAVIFISVLGAVASFYGITMLISAFGGYRTDEMQVLAGAAMLFAGLTTLIACGASAVLIIIADRVGRIEMALQPTTEDDVDDAPEMVVL